MKLSTYISDLPIEKIVNTISYACFRYKAYNQHYEDLFYKAYTTMRKKSSVTAAVLSAFSPSNCQISGFISRDIYYGLNGKLAQPELTSDNVVLQIYSDGSNLDNKPVKERSKRYNKDLDTNPIFLIIVFSVNKDGILSEIQVKLPNERGEIIETETIFESTKSVRKAV